MAIGKEETMGRVPRSPLFMGASCPLSGMGARPKQRSLSLASETGTLRGALAMAGLGPGAEMSDSGQRLRAWPKEKELRLGWQKPDRCFEA